MLLDGTLLLAVDGSIHVLGEQKFQIGAGHKRPLGTDRFFFIRSPYVASKRGPARRARDSISILRCLPAHLILARFPGILTLRDRAGLPSRAAPVIIFARRSGATRSLRVPRPNLRCGKSSRFFLRARGVALQWNRWPGRAWCGDNDRSEDFATTAPATP